MNAQAPEIPRASSTTDGEASGQRIAAVTGANGYVGSIVCHALEGAGFGVRRLIRQPRVDGDFEFSLADGCSREVLSDIELLVHCAWDLTETSRTSAWKTNVFGTRLLFEMAVECNVGRTILISSMSAYSGTKQNYGRAKLATELEAFARQMCAVRPGLVYGPTWGGMAGTLRKLARLPFVPLVGREARQFTLHEDDLAQAIVALANAEFVPSRPIGLANPESISFEQLLRAIAQFDRGVELRFVRVPWLLLYWALRVGELTPVRLPVRADSLLGLVRSAKTLPNPKEVEALSVEFRPFGL